MSKIKELGSTGIYAWTTLISCFICIPGALYFEGPTLKAGMDAAIAKVNPWPFSQLSNTSPPIQFCSSSAIFLCTRFSINRIC